MYTTRTSNKDVTGPLQARIVMLLKDKPLCGKDMMKKLKLRSPGTIYPVLEGLRKRQLIDYQVESTGSTRKKMYVLTEKGRKHVRESLMSSARMFCCDASMHLHRILQDAKGQFDIKRHQKILCTLEYDEVKEFLRGADITFSSTLDVDPEQFDQALSFLGVGCLIGSERVDVNDYVTRIHKSLKKGGGLLVIEIEKTDNIFAKIFFQDILKLSELPGMRPEELDDVLTSVGFKTTKIVSKSGLLYGTALKA